MKTFPRILLLVVVAAATAIAIFYAWTDWAGARHWKAVEAELRAKGEPLTIDELVPKPIPDEMNFAAVPIFAEVQKELDRNKWRISQIPRINGASQGSSPLVNAARSMDPKFNGSQQDAAHLILARMETWKPLLDEVREAAQRPGTDWKFDYTDPLHMRVAYGPALLDICKVLVCDAEAHLELGDSTAALADFDLILNLSERAATPPILIGHLIRRSLIMVDTGVVKFGIERHAWTEPQLEMIQHALGHIALKPELIEAYRFERAAFNDIISKYSREAFASLVATAGSDAHEQLMAPPILWALRPSGWTNEDQCAFSEGMQSLIQNVAAPIPDSRLKSNRAAGGIQTMLRILRTPFTALGLPSTASSLNGTVYTQTFVDEARTACAIERYRLAHGTLPPDLNALCPEFLSAVPLDPMSGQSLHYKPGPGDSYILYSVGWNQKDDGGSELSLEHKKGPTPPSEALDWLWKIGNPS
jgi:hypothetical protein